MTVNKTITVVFNKEENSIICNAETILERLSYIMSCDDVAYINGNTYSRSNIDSARLLLCDLCYQKNNPIKIEEDD